jgi:polysaccharide biosynthesis transport protein
MTFGPYQLSDLVSAFRRRFWLMVLSVGLIAPIALAVAYFMPAKYRSEALILVESQQISLVESTVTASAAERLQLIRQKLMTRENLLELIGKFDLYADRTDMSPTEKVALVRANTQIEPIVLAGQPRNALLSFTISFTASSGPVAARVANEFVSKVISENVRNRQDRAEGTLAYFQQEVETLSARLGEIEATITRYQNANEGALPDSLEFRREELSNLQEREFQRAQNRLALVEQKRGLEEALRTGRLATTLPQQQLTQEERDLQALRNTLLQRRAVLAETHPEIVAIKRRIEALEQAVAPSSDPAAGERSSALQRIAAEIALLDQQIALLDRQQAEDDATKAALVASIAATPQVAMEINRLERQYTQLQGQYSAAVARLAAAREGAVLEDKQQGERFEVAEQPQVPDRPYSPNRPVIAAGGVAFSVMVGLGLMVLFELMNTSIRTAHALEYRTGLKPVVSIPYVRTRGERRRRLMRWLGMVLLLVAVISAILYAIDQFYLPLDALVDRIAQKLGIDSVLRIIEIRLGR